MDILVGDYTKATGSQITTGYHQVLQNGISEHVYTRTLTDRIIRYAVLVRRT